MRNIYDIISEQRVVADINISKHDLNYMINHFDNNDYYIQEGLGEGLKNAAKKVVEFIQALIQKITELIGKMINFLLGERKTYQKSMAALKDAEVGKADDGKADDKKDAGDDKKDNAAAGGDNDNVYDKNIHKGKSPGQLHIGDILKGSLRTVNIKKYVSFEAKKQLTEDFFDGVNTVVRNYSENENANNIKDVFVNSVERKCFKGDGSFKKVPKASIPDRIKLELKEGEPAPMKVRDINVDIFMSYVGSDDPNAERTDELKAYFDKVKKDGTVYLNNLKSRLEKLKAADGSVSDDSISRVQQVASMVSAFINYMTTDVFQAYNTLDNIAKQAIGDYMRAYNIRRG